MASDNHAHYSKIGFAVLLGIAAIVATLIWLGGAGGEDEPVLVETYYEKSITGLSVGSSVNFRGVPIGKVTLIDFIGNHYSGLMDGENTRIYIQMSLNRMAFHGVEMHGISPETAIQRLIKLGLRATLSASGITGLSHIEFDIYPDAPPPQEITWTPRSAYIPSKMSLLENFSSAATRVMSQINTMDFAGVGSNITTTTENLAESVRSARMLLDGNSAEIGHILNNVSEATDSIKELSADLRRNPSALIRERRVERLDETR